MKRKISYYRSIGKKPTGKVYFLPPFLTAIYPTNHESFRYHTQYWVIGLNKFVVESEIVPYMALIFIVTCNHFKKNFYFHKTTQSFTESQSFGACWIKSEIKCCSVFGAKQKDKKVMNLFQEIKFATLWS